jgi:hypothetical protein
VCLKNIPPLIMHNFWALVIKARQRLNIHIAIVETPNMLMEIADFDINSLLSILSRLLFVSLSCYESGFYYCLLQIANMSCVRKVLALIYM